MRIPEGTTLDGYSLCYREGYHFDWPNWKMIAFKINNAKFTCLLCEKTNTCKGVFLEKNCDRRFFHTSCLEHCTEKSHLYVTNKLHCIFEALANFSRGVYIINKSTAPIIQFSLDRSIITQHESEMYFSYRYDRESVNSAEICAIARKICDALIDNSGQSLIDFISEEDLAFLSEDF